MDDILDDNSGRRPSVLFAAAPDAIGGPPVSDGSRTPARHLLLLYHEAVLAVIRCVAQRASDSGKHLEDVFADFPFLEGYWKKLRSYVVSDEFGAAADQLREQIIACAAADQLREQIIACAAADQLREQIIAWEEESERFLPFRALLAESGLDRDALSIVCTIGLVEEDSNFGSLFAALQAPLGHRRPAVALLRDIVADETWGIGNDVWERCESLTQFGLLELLNAEAPRSEWLYRVPVPIWTAIHGVRTAEPLPGIRRAEASSFLTLQKLILAETERTRIAGACDLLKEDQAKTLVVRGMPGTQRIDVVGAVARALGRDVLTLGDGAGFGDEALAHLGMLCTLTRAMPALEAELGPGETLKLPKLPGYSGPIAVILGREGGLADADRALAVELSPDGPELRLRHWQRVLGDSAGAELRAIAETFALSGGYIRECAPLAIANARLAGRSSVGMADVQAAARGVNRQRLDTLAVRMEPENLGWQSLVAAGDTASGLHDLEQRCRRREGLVDAVSVSFPGGLNRGVRALFEGPSGTGKTLAARVLSGALGLDVYRIDLASVVNKYIGESEKELSRVLGRAEDLDVILLLDEGDALMARRTEVRNANDRYANLQTNYLLQRLETYQGIVIVTTNLGGQGGIDPAFRRRMDVTVRFHAPGAEERFQLWCAHLAPDHAVPDALLEKISLRYRLTGGQIRNAVAYASVRALGRGDRVGDDDVLAGIEIEHRKAGAAFVAPRAEEPAADDGLAHFLDLIA